MIKEIFRTGTWTDANGITRKFTEQDIDKMLSMFSNEKSETTEGRKVPLTPGHPNDNDPALGWVSRVWRDGKSMFAEFVDIIPEAIEAIKAKSFREVSIALSGSTLRHVGLLGAVPPAVPGMGGFQFADADYSEYEFVVEEDLTDKIMKVLKKLNFKQKTGDHKMTALEDKLTLEVADLKKENAELTSNFAKAKEEVKLSGQALKDAEAGKKKSDEELAKANEQIEQHYSQTAESTETAWIDKMIEGKKLLPADKESTAFMLKTLRGQESMDFKVGDKTEKKTPASLYMEKIEAGPEVLNTEKLGKGAARGEQSALEIATREYQAKNAGLTYQQASAKVREINPALEDSE